ncbi:MAG TPA: glycosylase [bacterium]|nr:glycosylase [bacterium]
MRQVIPAAGNGATIDERRMADIYERVKTPYKYGIVLAGSAEEMIDCPNVFRHHDRWYMIYIAFDGRGYETRLAESEDLLNWTPKGPILQRSGSGWDAEQAAAGLALIDYRWQGEWRLQKHADRYWLSYLGGALPGYETPPLSIGMAASQTPTKATQWKRTPDHPVLTPSQPDSRDWERDTLFKSHILYDPQQTLGFPFVMFYNARQLGPQVERIGMAVSQDLRHWQRYGVDPVIDHGPKPGICGDPQVVRIDDLWVMFYFGAFWQPNAFDTFACSYDLVHWTDWNGPHLIEPSEPWDATYAHKPWLVTHEGIVYHFYCAVGDQGRVIALATSKKLR